MRARRTAWLLLVLGLLALPRGGARADTTPRLGADANPADLADPFTFTLNPALAPLVRPQAAAGFQVLHWGLLPGAADLNTGAVMWGGRQAFGGLTAGASWLETPLWADRAFSAGYGRHVLAGLSLGVRAGLEQRAFNRDRFDLSYGAADDPLLAGSLARTVPTLALGASYSLPWQGVTAGFVLENPHEPNISLDGDDAVTLSATVRAGVAWESARGQLSVGLADDRWRTRWSAGGRWSVLGEHGLLARFDTDRWAVGARIAATERVWVEYTFTESRSDLASASSGSHGIVVCLHAPGREPLTSVYRHHSVADAPYAAPAAAAVAPHFPTPAAAPLPAPTLGGPQLQLAAADTALIRVKRLVRTFDSDVDMARVRRLPRWRIGVMDSTWSERVAWDVGAVPLDGALPEARGRGVYSEAYQEGVAELQSRVGGGRDLVIAAEPDQLERARFLAARVAGDSLRGVEIRTLEPVADPRLRAVMNAPVGSAAIPAVEEVTLRQFAAIPLRILALGDAGEINGWTLEIRDSDGQPVRAWAGVSTPPAAIGWDWTDTDGRPVDVDVYTCELTWRDRTGLVRRAPRREIVIARQTFQRTLAFGRDQAPLRALPDAVPVLILDPGTSETPTSDRSAQPDPADVSRADGAEQGRTKR